MNKIHCEHCGQVLFDTSADGLILHAGGLIREVHGICKCKHGYHWSVCERTLERILERYNQRKVEISEALNEL